MKTVPRCAGILLLGALALTGCTAAPEPLPTSTAPVVQIGAPGEPNKTLSPDEIAALEGTPYNEHDVAFIRDMLHHHSQALEMTALVKENSTDGDVRLLAERMEIGQTDEIELMEGWLQARGEPARDPDAAHGEHNLTMPGLLTDAEMAQLAAATGTAFDRLFLEFMTRHHQGAIDMVHALYNAGGGMESEVDQIAREVEGDQNIEIKRMNEMLAARS